MIPSFGTACRTGPDPHYALNERAGSDTFVNARLDGARPLAMEGLLRHHCALLRGERILLHLSLLWLGSLQWQAFRRTAERLRSRGNRVSMLLGPLNEDMLAPSSATAYRETMAGVRAWLNGNGFVHYAPPTLLPSCTPT